MIEIASFVIPVMVTVFTFSLVKMWMEQRAAARVERTRLLEQALKNPNVDRQTIEALAHQLTGVRSPRQGVRRSWFMATVLGLGWLALFTGVPLWVIGINEHEQGLFYAGVITAVAGFCLVTYPFALRELEARRAES